MSLAQTGCEFHFADEHPVRGKFEAQSYEATDSAIERYDHISGGFRHVLGAGGDERVERCVRATVETDGGQRATEHSHVATAHVVCSQTRRREVACRVEAERELNDSAIGTHGTAVVAPANPVVALQQCKNSRQRKRKRNTVYVDESINGNGKIVQH